LPRVIPGFFYFGYVGYFGYSEIFPERMFYSYSALLLVLSPTVHAAVGIITNSSRRCWCYHQQFTPLLVLSLTLHAAVGIITNSSRR